MGGQAINLEEYVTELAEEKPFLDNKTDEIKVGDEVIIGEEGRNARIAVVHLVGNRNDGVTVYQCINSGGHHDTVSSDVENIRKTGRHFSQIEEILNQMKEYKENPDNYKGNVADVSTVLRVALTTKSMTPDLYEIMKLLGKDRIINRINLI